jgi:hypothetical protein
MSGMGSLLDDASMSDSDRLQLSSAMNEMDLEQTQQMFHTVADTCFKQCINTFRAR